MIKKKVSISSGGKCYKLLAGVLAIYFLSTLFSGVVFAKNTADDVQDIQDKEITAEKTSKHVTQKEYDKEQLEGYLTGGGYTEEDNLKISQKFSIDDNTEVSYVFSGDNVIGSYVTTEVEGEKLSSFTFDSTSDEVKSVYEETSEIQKYLN